MTSIARKGLIALALAAPLAIGTAFGHGDVTPQPVDTTGLEPIVGADWLKSNPYRGNAIAIEKGSSGYNQNCARCHGLQAISGGLAPDLRYLEPGDEGDEWFVERVSKGVVQDGITRMPKFQGVISQEGLWAIRTYLESRYDG